MPRSDARCTCSHFSTTAVDWAHVLLHGIVNRPCATMAGPTKRESLQVQKCNIWHLRPLYYHIIPNILSLFYLFIIIIVIIISTTIIWLDLYGSCMDSLRPGTGTYYQFAKALKLSEGHLDCHFGSFWRETAVTRPWLGRHLRRSWHLKSRERSRSTWPQMGHRWNTDGTATKASRRPVTSSLSKICEAKLQHPAVTCILQEFTSAPWTNGAVSAVRMPGTPWVGVMRWSGIGGIGDDTGQALGNLRNAKSLHHRREKNSEQTTNNFVLR
jgi:hypothetical protein